MLEKKAHFLFYALFSALPLIIGSALMGPYVFSSFFMGGILVFLFSCFWGFIGLCLSSVVGFIFLFSSDMSLFSKTRPLAFLSLALVSSFLAAALEKHLQNRDRAYLQEKTALEEKVRALTEKMQRLEKEQKKSLVRKKIDKEEGPQLEFW